MIDKRRRQISILLTIVALLLWSHSVLYARLEIGHFGLISGLPITFFVALALLTVASAMLWVSKEKHGKLLGLQLLILISALGLIPLITGGSPPIINHGYRNLGYIDYIVRQNHFDTSVSLYLSWPGVFIVSAIVAKIGSINFEPLLSVSPLFLSLLLLPPLYVFLKNTLGEARSNYCWAGCWLFYLAFWGGANLINPPGIAFFLLLTMLALVTSPSVWRKDSRSFVFTSMIILTFAALTITHLLTSLAALGIIAVLSVIRLDKRLALVTGACLLLLVAWNLTGAGSFAERKLPEPGEITIVQPVPPPGEAPVPGEALSPTETLPPAEEPPPSEEPAPRGMIILDPEVLVDREVTGHLSGTESHVDIARIRILFSGIFALIGLAGAILAFVARRDFKANLSLLAITIIPLVLVTLSGHYAREILTRLYLFTLPGMAYFGASLFNIKKGAVTIILCLLLIIAIPLYVIAQYGNQELDYISPAELSGMYFFHNETNRGLAIGAFSLGRMKNIERYRHIGLERLKWENGRLVLEKWMGRYLPFYIGISRQDRARYEWFRGNTQFIDETEQELNKAVNCDFIYSNPDLKLYICEGR